MLLPCLNNQSLLNSESLIRSAQIALNIHIILGSLFHLLLIRDISSLKMDRKVFVYTDFTLELRKNDANLQVSSISPSTSSMRRDQGGIVTRTKWTPPVFPWYILSTESSQITKTFLTNNFLPDFLLIKGPIYRPNGYNLVVFNLDLARQLVRKQSAKLTKSSEDVFREWIAVISRHTDCLDWAGTMGTTRRRHCLIVSQW